MKITKRQEDMSPDGTLELIRQNDGDIIVCVRESQDSTRGTGTMADVEFCNSGGHSPWTLQALYALQEAMVKDERREPWPAREEDICEFCLEPENNGGSHGDGNCFEGDYKFGEER